MGFSETIGDALGVIYNLIDSAFFTHAILVVAAVILFIIANWIGKNSNEFGYSTTSIFEDEGDSVVTNFLIRALVPVVGLIFISAIFQILDLRTWVELSYLVAIYYLALRVAAIFIFERYDLVNWVRFVLYNSVGTVGALLVHKYIVLPGKYIFPDLNTIGNELWLAIAAFIFAVTNSIKIQNPHSNKKKNLYLRKKYDSLKASYGAVVADCAKRAAGDRHLVELIAYSIIVYEDYSRPRSIRFIERMMIWKTNRTTGIMQFSSEKFLSNEESIRLGVEKIANDWLQSAPKMHPVSRIERVIANYNADIGYVHNVIELMEILSKRIDRLYLAVWDRHFSHRTKSQRFFERIKAKKANLSSPPLSE